MAHSCPSCGSCCYCNGDIDDACLDEPSAVARCCHCDRDSDDEPEESAAPAPVWHDSIPLNHLQVGDNVRATVICKTKPPSWNNRRHSTNVRNGTITEILGHIVRIKCSTTLYAITLSDIIKAWGYRPPGTTFTP